MKKQYRIKDTREFGTIIGRKRFYTSPSFTIYVKERACDHARVGISVGKKLGNAVMRNKVKRQVRSMVREIYTFEEKFDTIILVRAKYHQENYGNNKKMLESLTKKVKI
jgi:ribonuclease P protein component